MTSGVVALAFVVASCSGTGVDEDGPVSTDILSSSEPPVIGDVNQWALEYTGGVPGIASGDPIRIGYVNSEQFFPESTVGVTSAIAFVNEELGGAAGRPLELVSCPITTATDGAGCGALLASDPGIVAVLTGTLPVGGAELFSSLNGVKPVIIGQAMTPDDVATTAGKSFMAGTPVMALGIAQFVTTQLDAVERVAVVANDTVGTEFAARQYLRPSLEKAGIRFSYFDFDDRSTPSDAEEIVRAMESEEIDVVVLLLTVRQCVSLHDVLEETDLDIEIVTTVMCTGTQMTNHLLDTGVGGPVPNNWYVVGHGFNYLQPDVASGMEIYVRKIQQYGTPPFGSSSLEFTGTAGPGFANVLTLTKFINQLGEAAQDFGSLDGVIRTFSGPMMLQAGPLKCEGLTSGDFPPMVSLCASQVGVQQYIDDRWQSVTDGLNGKPLDVAGM